MTHITDPRTGTLGHERLRARHGNRCIRTTLERPGTNEDPNEDPQLAQTWDMAMPDPLWQRRKHLTANLRPHGRGRQGAQYTCPCIPRSCGMRRARARSAAWRSCRSPAQAKPTTASCATSRGVSGSARSLPLPLVLLAMAPMVGTRAVRPFAPRTRLGGVRGRHAGRAWVGWPILQKFWLSLVNRRGTCTR